MRTGLSMAPQTQDGGSAVADKQPLKHSSPLSCVTIGFFSPFFRLLPRTLKVNYEFVLVPDTPYFTCSIFLFGPSLFLRTTRPILPVNNYSSSK